MKNILVFLACFLICWQMLIAQGYNSEVAAKITLNIQEDKMVTASGRAHNITAINKSLRYVLSVIKTGPSGNKNKNDQQGRFVLAPGQKKELSKITINIEEKDRTIILLLVYEDEQLVGKDRKVFDGTKNLGDANISSEKPSVKEEDMKNEDADGIFSKAMVIEDTKTKAGNDFYRYFYSDYLSYGISGEKMIKVEEDFAMANTTRISVKADDKVVAQFLVNPRSDFLKEMAQKSVNQVNNYFLRLQKNKEQIKRY